MNSEISTKEVSLLTSVKSEWIKFKSLRSNWVTLILTMLVIIGFSVLSAVLSHSRHGHGDRSTFDRVLTGANFAVLIIMVFGTATGAREFSSGLIRVTFSAIPKRWPVLFGKIVVFTSITLPLILISVVSAFFLGMSLFKHYGLSTVKWSDPNIPRAVIGFAFYIIGLGVIGLAVGALVRHTAAAIGIVIGGILFLPALLGALLPSSWQKILEYLPSNAGGAFTTPHSATLNLLSPGSGALVFGGWIIIAIVGAFFSIVKRDA